MTSQMMLVSSLMGYLVLGVLFQRAPKRELWLLLALVLFVIKDITVYALSFNTLSSTHTDISKSVQEYNEAKVTTGYMLAVINRIYIFPVILTIYLVYLLINQTELWDLHLTVWYLMTSETFLLVITILSGIFLVYKEEQDKQYEVRHKSLGASYAYYILSVCLGLLTTYILYNQIKNLDVIGNAISVISGLLVFLVGVLLMEDESNESETTLVQ